jgi:hypothetical protein
MEQEPQSALSRDPPKTIRMYPFLGTGRKACCRNGGIRRGSRGGEGGDFGVLPQLGWQGGWGLPRRSQERDPHPLPTQHGH